MTSSADPVIDRRAVLHVGPTAQMPYVDSGPYVFARADQSAPGDVTSLTYGDGALHWAYSAGDDTLDNFQILWTQTFDGKDPVWPDWAYAMAAPRFSRDFELTFSITGHAAFAVRRHSANGDGSAATCDEPDMVPAAIPALNLEIDSNNDGSIDLNDEAIEANPNYPGKIIPLADASGDPDGTQLWLAPDNLDDSDTVTFNFDSDALTLVLPNAVAISANVPYPWSVLSALVGPASVLVMRVWGREAGAEAISATVTDENNQPVGADTVNLSVLDLNLTACRTGGNWGQAVDETTQDGHNPDDYVVLVNNDFEQNSPLGNDLTAYKVTIPTSTSLPLPDDQDDDLIKLTLSPPPSWVEHGELQLNLSNTGWSDLRIFDAKGYQIYDGFGDYPSLRVNLDHPEGPLAALANGDPVTLYAEAKTTDGDLAIYYDYVSADLGGNAGALSGRDQVDMRLADWSFQIPTSSSFPKQTLIDASASDPTAPIPTSDRYYGLHVDGLPSSLVQNVHVSNSSGDQYDEEILTSSSSVTSKYPGVFYLGDTPTDLITSAQRTQIKNSLGLDVISVHEAQFSLTTGTPGYPPIDEQHRTLRPLIPDLILQGMAEDIEDGTTAVVAVNNDDDNDNGIPDLKDTGTVAGEDDLVEMKIRLPDNISTATTMTLGLESGADQVKVWTSPTDKTPATFLLGQFSPHRLITQHTWETPQEMTVYVEGINESSIWRGVGFVLTLNLPAALLLADPGNPHADRAAASVGTIQIDPLDAKYDSVNWDQPLNYLTNPAAIVVGAGRLTRSPGSTPRACRLGCPPCPATRTT